MNIKLNVHLEREASEGHFANYQVLSMREVSEKYDISILNPSSYNRRIEFLVFEINERKSDLIVFENPCYTVQEVEEFNNLLNANGHHLVEIFLPGDARIESRLRKASEETNSFGGKTGVSQKEVEEEFVRFRNLLEAIERFSKSHSIVVTRL